MERPVVAIVQARAGSTRLPGKVLLPLLGRPMLARVLERVALASSPDQVVVATSSLPVDDPVASTAEDYGVAVFRGSEHDVVDRFLGAAEQFGAHTIVRITADCPLIDPRVIDLVVGAFAEFGESADLVTNATADRSYPDGMDVEVFGHRTLLRADRRAKTPTEREHVTWVMLRTPGFTVHPVHLDSSAGCLRLSVDTPEDLERVREIFAALYPDDPAYSLDDILGYLRSREAPNRQASTRDWESPRRPAE